MREETGDHTRRYVGLAASILVTLVLVGCGGLGLLPTKSDVKNTSFKSYQSVEAAYQQIAPGTTRTGDLVQYGFDASDTANVEVLSYLGVIERFIPRDSIRFDTLDPVVQKCIEAREQCTGYVFHPERLHEERLGNWFLDMLGFQHTTVSYGWQAEVVLLVMDGRVAYKVMSGKPHIEDFHHDVEPLGPFQDLTGTVMHTAAAVPKY